MKKVTTPKVRFFMRAKGYYGRVSAVVTYDKERRFITFPQSIGVEIFKIYDSALNPKIKTCTEAEALLYLNEFQYANWLRNFRDTVLLPYAQKLVDEGKFSATTSADWAAMVVDTLKRWEDEERQYRKKHANAIAAGEKKAEELNRLNHERHAWREYYKYGTIMPEYGCIEGAAIPDKFRDVISEIDATAAYIDEQTLIARKERAAIGQPKSEKEGEE